MQLSIKRILLLAYLLIGFVWCTVNLPNLIARAKGNALFATGLYIFRFIAWPVLAPMEYMKHKKTLTNKSEGDTDESTETTT
jgi:hypothetical protein